MSEKVSEISVRASNSNRGGARSGAGRPKGSGNKLTIDKLLAAVDQKLGQPLEDQIAENYVRSLADPKLAHSCLLYTSPSPRDGLLSRMPSSA